MLFLRRENYINHRKYEDELTFLASIKNGDLQSLQEQLNSKWPSDRVGKLSDNPLQSAKYLFTCLITTVARIAVESGMELETAYGLSDIYIQTVDKYTKIEEVAALRREMLMDYTKQIYEFRNHNVFSKPIIMSLDYIYDNLHQIINIDELAENIGLSQSYFSTLFKKEMGVSASEYIRRKRIEATENMLRYSDYSLIEISQYLAFSSYSHFADIFSKYTGISPKEYRKRFFRKMKRD
jgi:AraC-like DNA-binding protein